MKKSLVWLSLVFFISVTMAQSQVASVLDLVNNGQLQKAEEIINEQLSNKDISTDNRIHYLASLGDIRFYQAQFTSALKYFHQALNLAHKTSNIREIAEQSKNIALTHSELGEFGESLHWHQETWKILIQNNWGKSDIALSVLLGQGAIYGNIGAYELSIETFNKAQKMAYKLEKFDALSNAYLRIASLQLKNSKPNAALSSLKLVDTVTMNDRSSLSWYYSIYADALLKLNRISEAQSLIQDAVNADIQWTDKDLIAFEVTLLESYLQQGDLLQATDSLDNLKNNSEDFETSWIFQFLLASKFKLENKHIKSFKTNIKALSLFFQYSSFNTNSDHNLYFHIPQDLVEATILSAFDVGLSDSDLMFELFYLAFLSKQAVQVKLGKLSEINTNRVGLAESSVIEDIAFGEASLNFQGRLKLSELQTVLENDEGFVFYLNIKNHIYSMLITKNNVYSTQLQSNSFEIKNLVIQFLTQLKEDNSNWVETANKINNLLIKPLRNYALDQLSTLYFIQDENLRFLPMDLLIDDQGILLSDRHEIAINTVKSIKKFINTKTKTHPKQNQTQLNLIGVSDGVLKIPSFWQTAYRNLNLSKINLPNINKELSQLEQKFSNSFITKGAKATETTAKQIISDSKGILHFASHGFDNPIAPAYSALVLKSDQNNDGLLQAREISKLTTQAELVVLASCSSAKGGLSNLYGYNSGIAESFIQAGAKTVIGTLWDVKDQKTYQFMQWFYQGLNQDLSVSKALSFAKKRARKASWKVYDWAAFIVLGQANLTLKLEQKESHYTVIILSLLLLLAVILILRHNIYQGNAK